MSGEKLLPHGKRVSTSSGPSSKAKPADRKPLLKKLLAAAYDSCQKLEDPRQNAACRRDFVFHMTDWMSELQQLAELYKYPEKFDKKAALAIVTSFLYHAPSHVRAAARLMLDWEPGDIFKELDGKPSGG